VQSFERIHRSNLVGMGVLPLQFVEGQSLALGGEETFDIEGIAGGITPGMKVTLRIHRPDGSREEIPLICRIDTADEAEYFRHGGILHYVLRNLMDAA
jgi:aconitate hydratase